MDAARGILVVVTLMSVVGEAMHDTNAGVVPTRFPTYPTPYGQTAYPTPPNPYPTPDYPSVYSATSDTVTFWYTYSLAIILGSVGGCLLLTCCVGICVWRTVKARTTPRLVAGEAARGNAPVSTGAPAAPRPSPVMSARAKAQQAAAVPQMASAATPTPTAAVVVPARDGRLLVTEHVRRLDGIDHQPAVVVPDRDGRLLVSEHVRRLDGMDHKDAVQQRTPEGHARGLQRLTASQATAVPQQTIDISPLSAGAGSAAPATQAQPQPQPQPQPMPMPMSAVAPLPAGWFEVKSPAGETIYLHLAADGRSSIVRPYATLVASPVSPGSANASRPVAVSIDMAAATMPAPVQ